MVKKYLDEEGVMVGRSSLKIQYRIPNEKSLHLNKLN